MPKLLADDRNDALYPVLDEAFERLRQFHLVPQDAAHPTDPKGRFNHRRAAAAFVHSVLLYDHPEWVARHPEGFTDGLSIYLAADHVEALLRDDRPQKKVFSVSNVDQVLVMALDDLVNQHAFPERPAISLTRVSRAEVIDLLRTVDFQNGTTADETLSTVLDPHAGPLLRRFYSPVTPSWDVGPLVDALPETHHGFAVLHPVNLLRAVARMNALSEALFNAWSDALDHGSVATPAVTLAAQALSEAFVQEDPLALRPAMLRLGHRLALLDDRTAETGQTRAHLASIVRLQHGFTEDHKEMLVEGLARFTRPPLLDPAWQPQVFAALKHRLSTMRARDLVGPGVVAGSAEAPSLSGHPMAVAVAAASGYTVTPVLERCIGDASTPAQQAWRDSYVYALPHAWMNVAPGSSDSSQDVGHRWRHATQGLPPGLADLALQGVSLLSDQNDPGWYDAWTLYQEAQPRPAGQVTARTSPGARSPG